MSYICMMANDNGAAVFSDSRQTLPFGLHRDDCTKTFISEECRTIWSCCGLVSLGWENLFHHTEKILRKDNLSIEERITRLVPYLRRKTDEFALLHRKKGIFNLLIADTSSGKLKVYRLDFVSGRAEIRKLNLPCFEQAGSNCRSLAPKTSCTPKSNDSIETICEKGIERVRESIAKSMDKMLADGSYSPNVGGNVQIKSITLK